MADNGAADRFAAHLAGVWSSGNTTSVTWLNHHSALRLRQSGTRVAEMTCVGIDGLLLLRLLGCAPEERTSADLVIPRLLPLLPGARIALLGASRPSVERAAEVIDADLAAPDAAVVAVRDGYGGLPSHAELGPWLSSCRPDVVLVGLGAGLQEQWVLDLGARLGSGLVLTCGGFLDQIHQPGYYPGWAYALRLNWAVRLARDPMRLWRRYSIEALHALRDRRALRREIECLAGFHQYRAVVTGRPSRDRRDK